VTNGTVSNRATDPGKAGPHPDR